MFGLNVDPAIIYFGFLVYLFPTISACAENMNRAGQSQY
jgi:hypothetical protein